MQTSDLAPQRFSLQPVGQLDSKTIGLLVVKYYPFVRAATRKILSRHGWDLGYEDYQDVTQNVMFKFPAIIQNYQECDDEIPFEQFLMGGIRNTVLDLIKRQVRRSKIMSRSSIFLDDDGDFFEVDNPVDENRMAVRKAFKVFQIKHPEMAQITSDYYFNDMNDPEIAAQQNSTKIQVWRLRKRALEKLHEFMEE